MDTIESKLVELRKQWTAYPEKRIAIELQARVLQMKAAKKERSENDDLVYLARKHLL